MRGLYGEHQPDVEAAGQAQPRRPQPRADLRRNQAALHDTDDAVRPTAMETAVPRV
jgi:hypothetical protein